MSMYAERRLNKGETIVQKAKLSPAGVIVSWVITGILFFVMLFSLVFAILFLISLIYSIGKTIEICTTELAVTNKKLVGKLGVITTKAMDAPLNKIQNISVSSGLAGKLLGYGTIQVSTAAGVFKFKYIVNADAFKGLIMEQIDVYEQQQVQNNAEEMARAMMMAQDRMKNN